MKRILSVLISFVVFVILSRLPVVPIYIASVRPDQTYNLRIRSFNEIFKFYLDPLDGVSYQVGWQTIAVSLALLAVGCLISALVFRILRN